MIYKSIDETLLDVNNFTQDTMWQEFIKNEVDALLFIIRKLIKLKIFQYDGKKICDVIKCLNECRNGIIEISQCFKPVQNTVLESEENLNEQKSEF